MKKIKGIIPPIIIPLTKEEKVDEEGFRKLLRRCVDNGIHGIFVAGTNGEVMGLTLEEREKTISIAIDECGEEVPVLCGAIDSSTKRVIENIKRIEQMGGEIAVVTPVFYSKHTCRNEIITHFEEVAKSTKLKIMLYNIPPFTGVNMQPQEVLKLSEIDNIIGIKDSSGAYMQFQKYLHHFEGTNFSVLIGNSDLIGIGVLMGANGAVPAIAPLFPELFIKLYDVASRGDIKQTIKLQKIVCETSQILSMAKNPISAVKYAVSTLGFMDEYITSPNEKLTDEKKQMILNKINKINDMDF